MEIDEIIEEFEKLIRDNLVAAPGYLNEMEMCINDLYDEIMGDDE